MVKSYSYLVVEDRLKILASKFNILLKHEERRMASKYMPLKNLKKCDIYLAKGCKN